MEGKGWMDRCVGVVPVPRWGTFGQGIRGKEKQMVCEPFMRLCLRKKSHQKNPQNINQARPGNSIHFLLLYSFARGAFVFVFLT